jgi:hypothetical protein
MEQPTAISKEEAEFEKLLAAAMEREHQRLGDKKAAPDFERCASSESPK